VTSRALPPDKADQLWQLFIQSLPEGNFDEECLQSFREVINPPPHLNSFAVIAENLPPIFDLIAQVATLGIDTTPEYMQYLGVWKAICSAAVAEKKTIDLRIPGFSRVWIENEEPPFRNYYESHCLGVALWCRMPGINQLRYRLAQAMLFVTINKARQVAAENSYSIANQLAGAGLSLRKLANKQYEGELALLPESAIPFQAYKATLKERVTDNSHPLYPLFHLMEIATGEKTVGTRTVHRLWGKHRGRASKVVELYGVDSEDDGRDGEVASAQLLVDPRRKRAKDHRVAGALCHSKEFAGRKDGIVTAAKGKDPSGGRSRSQQYIEAKATAERIALDNQMLATDLDRLVPYEIVWFLVELDEIASWDTELCGISGKELAAFLTICFWTSRPVEEVLYCSEVPSVASSKEKISIFRETDGKLHWVLYAMPTRLRYEIEKNTERQALPIATRYTLPFTSNAARTLEPWLGSIALKQYATNWLFKHQLHEYEAAIAEFFKIVKEKHRGRQNFYRINIFFHELLSRLPGSDVTLAIAISGRSDKTGQVPHYYTAHSLQRVQNVYCNAVNELWATYARTAAMNVPFVKGSADTYVGSRFVPRREVIRGFISSTKTSLAKLRQDHDEFEKVLRFHNIYTAYTICLVGFSTGYRAVIDPLFHDAEIDRTSGFAVISDKDGDDFYNSRIVWLPPVCLEQLEHYALHLNTFRRWLFTHNQDLFFISRKKNVIGRRADRRTPSLFFVDPQEGGLKVRPKHLEELMKIAGYHLPANANRHYLRTNLLERGCPLEIINAFMGHWERGLEPWGKYSGLSPDVYRQEVARFLVPMLLEDDWTAEPGLGQGRG